MRKQRSESFSPFVICAALLLATWPARAQQGVDIEKATNGQDADSVPGPFVAIGSTVNWTYQITNTSGRTLVNIVVTDDQGVVVACPATTLGAGESMTCTASGVAMAGQYTNLGTVGAEDQAGTPSSDSDPSHYFGTSYPDAITIEKSTDGFDADTPPGPVLPVGSTVNWTYEVTNTGADPLDNVEVTDDQGVVVSCPGSTLAPGESMTCTASGVVQPGQYANLGSVTANMPSEETVGASDPSHYFGQTLLLEKATNGQDADVPPGPVVPIGAPVSWTYTVTNPGPETVTGLVVTDDQSVVPNCPATTIAAGASVVCTASGSAQAGQYANVGTATANLPLGGQVSASDLSHYLGQPLTIQKSTNGQDADLPPGPVLAVGVPVNWTYEVANLGTDPLTNVEVIDDQGVTVTCPATTLAAGASMTCTGSDTSGAGQYSNIGTVTADGPGEQISASDPSHYFGQGEVLDFGDAADPAYPTRFAANGARHLLGSGVFLGACVDSELDGQPSAGADGDDAGPGISIFGTCATPGDDEDGVAFTSALAPGTTASVEVVANEACTLSAHLDFNADGDFSDPGEALFAGGQALAAGVNPLSFAVPAGAVPGPSVARFRCTTDGAVAPAGQASDGEVEDHVVAIGAPDVSATKTVALTVDLNGNGLANPGDTLTYTVTITNSGSASATGVTFADTPDGNTSLVVGSVTTTAGTVTTGDTGGDTTVAVDVGTLAASDGNVTITFQVTIVDPLPSGVVQVSNQGAVSGDLIGPVLTDDPAVGGASDPTVITVGAISVVEIPTLAVWALALLAGALALAGMRRLMA